MDDKSLIATAKKAMVNAYVPYSNFPVGAALLCGDGTVITGCNVENASYGATCCAERAAIFFAVSLGKRYFTKMAVVSASGKLTPPCGICRQVLMEFMPKGEVILENEEGEIFTYSMEELLPLAFHL